MYTWEIPGKNEHPKEVILEFRMKCYVNGKEERECRPLKVGDV